MPTTLPRCIPSDLVSIYLVASEGERLLLIRYMLCIEQGNVRSQVASRTVLGGVNALCFTDPVVQPNAGYGVAYVKQTCTVVRVRSTL